MRWLVFFPVLLLFSHGLRAQQPDLAAADAYARSVPRNVRDKAGLDSLVHMVNARFSHPVEKIRAMFTWVAVSLEYDCGNDTASPLRPISMEQVLKTGRSQCAGYSNLLQYSLRAMGFETVTVRGIARTAKKDLWWKEAPRPNHAWNAVKVGGQWQLLDATWASGASNDDCSVVNREFASFYFFPPPGKFLLSHLPSDSNWQLTENRMELQEFLSLPVFHDPYYEWPVTEFSPARGVLALRGAETITFSFRSDRPLENIAVWCEEDKSIRPEFGNFIRKGNVYSYTYRPKKGGSYFLNVSLDGRRTAVVYFVNVVM
jgi:transglutaminase/protease-like cytokinesis protein 3